ncbi:MAG: formylglycine-generating enzyme family protein [Maribacter sp.]|nr:formylglycine-generating enzyme family protein [Maribacter sp.]
MNFHTKKTSQIPSFLFSFLMVSILLVSCKSTVSTIEPAKEESKEESNEVYTETIPVANISFDMVLIPEGEFLMGSPVDEMKRREDEGPQRKVVLDAFWMGKYEVSWREFELFFKQNQPLFQNLEADKLNAIDAITRPSPPYEDPSYGMGKDDFPAVSMSTYSALVFCKWLSEITGRFYRLPTEAEWEYAARAGSQTIYSFGNSEEELEKYAVYYKNSNSKYAKRGTKLPNKWGLYDMHGNVAEWTLDQYKQDAYANMESKNPWVIPRVFHPRVIRGGSWDDDAENLRSASRMASSTKLQKRDPQIPKSFWWFTDSNFIGMRLVSPKNQPSQEDQDKFWQMVLDEG